MIIVGSKGFAKEVFEVIYKTDATSKVVFFDNVTSDLNSTIYDQYPIITSIEKLKLHIKTSNSKFTLGLGSPQSREKLSVLIRSIGGELTSVISEKASIGSFGVEMGLGVNIMQNVIITSGVRIGEGVLLNINCTVGHGTTIGEYTEICPGVNISGNCSIGKLTFIGTNCTILPGIKIGSNVIIGAGSLVTKDIEDNTVVYGSPAKAIVK